MDYSMPEMFSDFKNNPQKISGNQNSFIKIDNYVFLVL